MNTGCHASTELHMALRQLHCTISCTQRQHVLSIFRFSLPSWSWWWSAVEVADSNSEEAIDLGDYCLTLALPDLWPSFVISKSSLLPFVIADVIVVIIAVIIAVIIVVSGWCTYGTLSSALFAIIVVIIVIYMSCLYHFVIIAIVDLYSFGDLKVTNDKYSVSLDKYWLA